MPGRDRQASSCQQRDIAAEASTQQEEENRYGCDADQRWDQPGSPLIIPPLQGELPDQVGGQRAADEGVGEAILPATQSEDFIFPETPIPQMIQAQESRCPCDQEQNQ